VRNGLDLNPTKADDSSFDEALADILHRQEEFRRRAMDGASGRQSR
jgi:hypothetical protein